MQVHKLDKSYRCLNKYKKDLKKTHHEGTSTRQNLEILSSEFVYVSKVEMNPAWQQGKLKEFCQAKGIKIAAFSPLGAAGAFWGTKGVLESEVLNEIAQSKGKSVAQVALRWAYE